MTIVGSLFMSRKAVDQFNGKTTPMRVIEDWLEYVLDDTGYDYYIEKHSTYPDDFPDLSTEDARCGSSECISGGALDEFESWASNNSGKLAKDFNLCITAADFSSSDSCSKNIGGCADQGGYESLAVVEGAHEIADAAGESPSQYTDNIEKYNAIHAGIHEIAHNLGADHVHGGFELYLGNCSASPMAVDSSANCEEECSLRVKLQFQYTNCSVSSFTIQ